MRRIGKIFAWTLAVIIGLPLLLVAVVLVGGNTGPGRRLIARMTPGLTGGEVHIAGLAGRFPDRLRAATMQIDDAHGPYLTVHDLVLDWSPLRLLHGVLDIDRLDATAAEVAREPVSSGSKSSSSSSLPVAVRLRQFQVDRLTIAAAVLGGTAAAKSIVVAVQGAGALQTMESGSGHLTVRQIGGSGLYRLSGDVTPQHIQATISAQEPAHGLIAGAAGLPDLGPIDIHAALDGPRSAVATRLAASAGPLRANVAGTVDLVQQAADLTVAATAPAMTPRPDVSWQSVDVHAHVQGKFTTPRLSGQVTIADLRAVGAGIGQLTANLSGDAGQAQVHAVLDKLTLPGQNPSLFAAAPVVLDATSRLDAPDRPVHFTLQQPLVQAQGTADTKGPLRAHVVLTLPELAPLAAAAGQTVQGNTRLTLDVARQGATTNVALHGTLGVTGGQPQAAALLGNEAHLNLAASLTGRNATLSKLHVTGRGADISAHGSLIDQRAALDWSASISDLSAIDPKLNGRIDASGQVNGPEEDLAAAMTLHGNIGARGIGTQGVASGPVTVQIDAKGLPHNPSGTVTAQGALLNAPIDVAAAVSQTPAGIDVTVRHAAWKSLQAQGALALPKGATIPQGTLHLQMARLADLTPLLGQPLSGSIVAALESSADTAKVTLTAQGLAMSGSGVSRASLDATITSPQDHPSIAATLTAAGIRAGTVSGATARLEAHGTENAVAMTLTASAPNLSGSAARIDAAATVDVPGKSVALRSLRAGWKGQDLRLLAPARLDLAGGAVVQNLRLGLRQAVLAVNGRVSPALDLTASLRDLPMSLADIVSPTLNVGGTIAAEARLTGSIARPMGTVRLTASGLRDNGGPGRALPPANLTAAATLRGTDAGLDVRLQAGPSHVAVTGTAPLTTTGALDLHADGALDLALLNPILTAEGRRVQGELALDAAVAGTATAPRITGTARLTGGEAQDYTMGVHITGLTALVQADGNAVRLVRLSGRAGPGTIGAQGTVGLAAPMPIDLTITADNARLLASPLITATIASRLTVQGDMEGMMTLAGAVHVQHALIQIPDKLPGSVAVLPVRVAGAPPPPPPNPAAKPAAGPADIGLNITLNTPGEVIVRGRGLNVALGGTVRITGTAAQPQPSGGLTLQRGTMSLISQTLTFSEGSIDFVGNGISDPGIHFVATSSNSNITATLTVSGTAQNPKITLSSSPSLPQDEILSQLLFNQSVGSLSPLQVAQIAAGLAQLSGSGGGVTDPLAGLRNSLGLDQLTVGSSGTGAPTVEAGRYLAPGVYLGAQQAATGNGTQATLQVNLTKGLKLETTAGTATPSATGAAASGQAASVGLTYQFQY